MRHLFAILALVGMCIAPLGAQAQVTPRPLNDCTIVVVTTGGTAVTVIAANLNRNYLFIENPSATVSGVGAESLFINADAAASNAGTSMEVANLGVISFPGTPGGYVPTGPISVVATTSGHKFVCKWN